MSEIRNGKTSLMLIFLIVFIDLIGFGIIIPVLPTYAERYGADSLSVGALLASYSLMQFFFTPFWGRLSDKVGRRPVLLISLFASALGYLIWGLADSLTMLFVSRIVAGIGNANIAVAQAYIADVTSEENRAKGMGMVGAAFGLGFVLGPAIGGVCAQFFGSQVIGYIASAFSALAFVLAIGTLKEPLVRSNAGQDRFAVEPQFYFETLKQPSLQGSLIIFFLSTFAFANMEATLVLLTEKWYHFDSAANSYMFAYIGVIMVLVQGGLIRRLSGKVPERILILVGAALITGGLVLTVTIKNTTALYIAIGLLAVGSGLNNPSNQSLISKLANPEKVGGVLGVGQSLSTLGRILGPIVGGWLFKYASDAMPYYFGAGTMLIVVLLSLSLPLANQRKTLAEQEQAVSSEAPA